MLTAFDRTCDKASGSEDDKVPVREPRKCELDLDNHELQKSLMRRRDRKKRRPKDEASDDEDFRPGELFNQAELDRKAKKEKKLKDKDKQAGTGKKGRGRPPRSDKGTPSQGG